MDDWLFETDGYYQWHHEVIGSPYAWVNGITGGGVKIAVISTGISINDDIDAGSIKANYNAITSSTSGCDDSLGDGTFVAGELVGAINDSKGVGVCPDADIYNIKIDPDSSTTLVKAIYKAIEWDVDIAVTSLAFDLPLAAIEDAAETAYQKGIAFFAPVGVTEDNCDGWPGGFKHVIAVAATDKNNMLAYVSSNSKNAEFAAPGTYICLLNKSNVPNCIDGSSCAAPIVAGEAALILSNKDNIKGLKDNKGVLIPKGPARVEALKKVMQASCIPAGTGTGRGIVYLPKALGLASVTSAPAAPSITAGEVYRSGSNYMLPVSITSPDLDTKLILYTTDGKKPTYNNGVKDKFSTLYIGRSTTIPIELNDYQKDSVVVNAIAISGMGMVSKVTTQKIMVNDKAYSLGITAPVSCLAPGKTLKMEAMAIPNNAKTKAVTWTVKYSGSEETAKANGVTISATGVITAKRDAVPGTYKVQAISKLTPTVKSTEYSVVVKSFGIKTIKAKTNKIVEYRNNTSTKISTGDLFGMFDIKRADGTDGAITEVYFTSSNPNVFKKGSSGDFYVVGPGNAVVTALAADNSGVKGALSINVVQNAVSIDIPSNGYDKVAQGKALTLSKPVVTPANSAVKNVVWSLDSAAVAAGVKVSGGKVITTKTTTPGTYTVYAKITNKDGTIITGTRNVEVISEQVTALTIDKTATVFREANSFGSNTSAVIRAKVTGGKLAAGKVDKDSLSVTLSNDNLLFISNVSAESLDTLRVDVLSLGNGTGKVNLTVAALDGSGKKAVCAITVANPVTNVKIAPAKAGDYCCVTAGKSLPLKATVAMENGKTTNTKVNWGLEPGDELYATISKTGVLTAKATADNKRIVTVYAEAADGSGAVGVRKFIIYKNVGKIEFTDSYGNAITPKMTVDKSGQGDTFYIKVNNPTTMYFGSFKLSSSNGNVATIRYTGRSYKNPYAGYCLYEFDIIGISKGSAKLTVSTCDGSQSATFNVTVKKTVPITE